MKKKAKKLKKTSKKISPSLRKTAKKFKSKIVFKSLKYIKIKKFIAPIVKESVQPVVNFSPKFEGFELPIAYGENKLVLMVRDPWWLYAYWEVTPEREREVLDFVKESGFSIETKVLRVYELADKEWTGTSTFFDIGIGFANNWYVDVGKPDRHWIAELGFRAQGGRFFALIRSNIVRTPRYGVSDVLDEEWLLPDELYWKIFGLSGGLGRPKSSLDVREVLERYLRGLGASENSARISVRPQPEKAAARSV